MVFGFSGCALRFCVVAAAWAVDRCRNAVSDCRKRAFGMLPYSIIILLFFQYLLAILTGRLTRCVEKSLWLPLMRGLSAKLTGGEEILCIFQERDRMCTPSVTHQREALAVLFSCPHENIPIFVFQQVMTRV